MTLLCKNISRTAVGVIVRQPHKSYQEVYVLIIPDK